MRFVIKHEIKGRMRIQLVRGGLSFQAADKIEYALNALPEVQVAKVYERTGDAVIYYDAAPGTETTNRSRLIGALKEFSLDEAKQAELPALISSRELNAQYKEELIMSTFAHYTRRLFVPAPIRALLTTIRSFKYIKKGVQVLVQRKIEVPVLDATAIGVSILRGDFATASSVMFLLGIGETLEEWTHKKSVDDLARSMSLRTSKVWLVGEDGKEVLVDAAEIHEGDLIQVHMGNVIPFDGTVTSGDAMVNQSSFTGEAAPVHKAKGASVFAGTIVEEGEVVLCVTSCIEDSRYEKIVARIEETQKLKSGLESKAEHLADRLVPYTFAGSALAYLLTQNVTRALAVLMVDFSCALKLAMPISVLSAIREAGSYGITVKGGKYIEAMAEADTIVFDKTGTLTKAEPKVAQVICFNESSEDEILRMAACMEEHFPHSMARAVVDAAAERELNHEEMHSKVEYIVAHGISTTIDGKKAIIGSYHFVMEDEACTIPAGKEELFNSLPLHYSHLYIGVEGKLVAVICIEDPLRTEAAEVICRLKETGITKVVMMTGDSERTAAVIAKRVGVDTYYAEVLPEDKSNFVAAEKAAGRKVIMIGDGINDSLALSSADVGIAISEGAEIAREIADVVICGDNLYGILRFRLLSQALMKRIQGNYRSIVGINSALIALGVTGVLQPTTSALFHNASTLAISMKSMGELVEPGC